MRYVLLGRTGVRVSEVCLGTMTFGNEADETASVAIMDRAVELGVNFFDTANVYNGGLTEEIVGRWLVAHREEIVLATKAHFPSGPGPNERGSSRRHLRLSVEQSLRRLKTDWIDVLYLHHWDDDADLLETLRALNDLVREGKVLYPAVSNFAAWQLVKAVQLCEREGLARIAAVQPMYNLLKRQAEVEILPAAASEGVAVFPYNPLGAGMLTGKYLKGQTGRLSRNQMYQRRYGDPDYNEIVRRFVAYAEKRSVSPAALAVAWVNAHPSVTASIVGARNVDQLNDTLGCLDIELSAEEWAEIGALAPEPPLATDRER